MKNLYSVLILTLFLSSMSFLSAQEINPRSGFIENKGQWHKNALFLTHTNDGDAWITKSGIAFSFTQTTALLTNKQAEFSLKKKSITIERKVHAVHMDMVNSTFNPAHVEKLYAMPGVQNYILGNDPKKWQKDVHIYKEVRIKNVYNGIDARFYREGGSIRYDFIVAPKANPSQIRFTLKGATSWTVNKADNVLSIQTVHGEYHHAGLKAYQILNGKEEIVPCSFVQSGNTIQFEVKRKDPNAPLIIDPIIYSTFLGGSGDGEVVNDVAVDVNFRQKEDAYYVGTTSSPDFPIRPGVRTIKGQDAFLAKFSKLSGVPVYTTFIGGDNTEEGFGVVVDSKDRPWICGSTRSTNFPNPGNLGGSLQGTQDGFILRLNNAGSAPEMGKYVGGPSSSETLRAIVADANSNVYVVGSAGTNFPTSPNNVYKRTNPLVPPPIPGGPDAEIDDALVGKYAENGTQIWASYLGSAGTVDIGEDIKLDKGTSQPIVSVTTLGTGYPVTAGALGSPDPDGQAADIGITKFNANGQSLAWSAVIGGSSNETNSKIDIDVGGNVYCVCGTMSANFPMRTPVQGMMGSDIDIAIFKLNSGGASLGYSTYCGGSETEIPGDIAVDATLRAYVAFSTNSTSLGTFLNSSTAYQPMPIQGVDGALVRLTSQGLADYGTYFGGNGADFFHAIAVDVRGNTYIGGKSASTDYPLKDAFDTEVNAPGGDAIATKFCISLSEPCTITFDITGEAVNKTICEGEEVQIGQLASNTKDRVSYEWVVENPLTGGSILNPADPRPFVKPTATSKYICTAYDGACCPVVSEVTVTVLPAPKVELGNEIIICEGESRQIGVVATGGSGNYSYSWEPKVNISDPNAAQPTVTPKVNTVYRVTVTDIGADRPCVSKDEIRITVNPKPIIDAGEDKVICAGVGKVIGRKATNGTPPFTYKWTPENGLDNPSSDSPIATPTQSQMYTVTVTDSKNCVTLDSVFVTVNPEILSSLPSAVTICANQDYTIKSGIKGGKGTLKILWEPATDLSSRFVAEPIVKKSTPGIYPYTVTITDSNNCTLKKTITLTVREGVTLTASKPVLDFGVLSSCISSKLDSVEITNNEKETIAFTTVESVTGDFAFADQLPININAGEKKWIKFRFIPTKQGNNSGEISLKTDICSLLFPIKLSGSKDALLTTSDPSSITFLNRKVCDIQKDTTLVIRNTTADKSITYLFDKATIQQPFELISPKGTVNIGPNSVQEVKVRINTAVAGDYNNVLTIPFSSENCNDSLKITLTTRIINPTIAYSTTMNLGTIVGCVQSKDTTLTIRNSSDTPITITQFSSSTILLQSNDLPLTLDKDEVQNIRVKITPLGDGAFSENIFIISEPCTVNNPLSISGNKAGVLFTVSKSIDFGVVPNCIATADITKDIEIVNKSGGTTVGRIKNIQYIGNDFTTDIIVGTTLEKDIPAVFKTKFNGNIAENKTFSTKAIITLEPCDVIDTIAINLTAQQPQLTLADGGIVLFSQTSTSPQTQSLVITNSNNFPWTIKSVQGKSPQVTTKPAGGNNFPIEIPANGSISIDVTLQANATIVSDTMIVEFDYGSGSCTQNAIAIVSIGDSPLKSTVTLGNSKVVPGELFDYPLTVNNIPQSIIGTNQTISGVLRYDKNLIVDREKKCVVVGEECEHVFTQNIQIQNPTIVNIPMLALLGDTTITAVKLKNISLGNLPISFAVIDGTITIDNTCTDEQRFFITTPPTLIKSVNPNPLVNMLHVNFSVSENGITEIYIIDLFGNKSATLFTQNLYPGEYKLDFPVNIASGTYLLHIRTATRSHSTRITVVD
jgi:hypothetical protein